MASLGGVPAGWLALEPRCPGEVPLRCWWAPPATGSARAGILVLPEVFGVNGWVRGVADRLAGEGYAALAVPLFARTAPDLELDYGPGCLQEGRSHKERTTAAELLTDVGRAAEWLGGILAGPGGGPVPLGCVGFCFGGHVALLAATLPVIAATCDCYGAGVASGRPGGGAPSLQEVPRIPGRLLCLCGEEDPLIPPADVEAIGAALAAANEERLLRGVPGLHRLVTLGGAGHGFLCDQREDHRPEAARRGWQELLAFFADCLG